MTDERSSRVVIVAGANRGIGLALIPQLAARAQRVLWAADLPDGGPGGGFYRDGRPVPW